MQGIRLNSLRSRFIAGAAALYFVIGAVWILISDQLLLLGIIDLDQAKFFNSNKGLLFVLLTTIVLVLAMRRVPPPQAKAPADVSAGVRTLVYLFALIAALLLSLTAGLYKNREGRALADARNTMRTVAEDRANIVRRWVEEPRRRAGQLMRDPRLSSALQIRENISAEAGAVQLELWGTEIRAKQPELKVAVLDSDGETVWGSTDAVNQIDLDRAIEMVLTHERSDLVSLNYDTATGEHQIAWLSPVMEPLSSPPKVVGLVLARMPAESLLAEITGPHRKGDGLMSVYVAQALSDGRLEPFARGVTTSVPSESLEYGIVDIRAHVDTRQLRREGSVFAGAGSKRLMAVSTSVPELPLAVIVATRQADWLRASRLEFLSLAAGMLLSLGLAMVASIVFWRRRTEHEMLVEKDHERALLEAERRRAESNTQGRNATLYDVQTGLPNRLDLRGELSHALERSQASGKAGALLLIALDRFEEISVGLGHVLGDEVLVLAGNRIRNSLRQSDFVARSGSHEFAVIMENVDQAEDVARLCSTLIDGLSKPMRVGEDQQARLSASIGVALIVPEGMQSDDLLDQANAALHQAKDAGSVYRFHLPELTTTIRRRLDLEARMHGAIERGEFYLHYQPLLNLRTGKVMGCEALLRWMPQESPSISPGEFIPVAERSGLIVPLGDWVLRTACRDMARWLAAGHPLQILAVNLSTKQLALPDIDRRVATALKEAELDARYLELEITESALAGDFDQTIEKLRRLKALGLHLAVDDFGTGYSSLTYLKRFPVDKLKIDQGFVRGIPADGADGEIVTAITAMAHALKLNVLAEGIERAEQLDFLTQVGCETGQGFLFSKALPESAFLDWMLARNASLLVDAAA